jgi:hypothetical protein
MKILTIITECPAENIRVPGNHCPILCPKSQGTVVPNLRTRDTGMRRNVWKQKAPDSTTSRQCPERLGADADLK